MERHLILRPFGTCDESSRVEKTSKKAVKEAGCQYRKRKSRVGEQPKRIDETTYTNIHTNTYSVQGFVWEPGWSNNIHCQNRGVVIHDF